MNSFVFFAVLAGIMTLGGAAPTQAGVRFNSLTSNALSANSLTTNSLTTNSLTVNSLSVNSLSVNSLSCNALDTAGSALDQLNGVAVEAIALPPATQH
jgi:hypothetical protein